MRKIAMICLLAMLLPLAGSAYDFSDEAGLTGSVVALDVATHPCAICGRTVQEYVSDGTFTTLADGVFRYDSPTHLPEAVEMTYRVRYWTCVSCRSKYQKDFRDAMAKAAEAFVADAKSQEAKTHAVDVQDELCRLESELSRMQSRLEALKSRHAKEAKQ